MRRPRLLLPAATAMAAVTFLVGPAWAASPHFVNKSLTVAHSGDMLSVSGQEAGLTDGGQVHIVLTASATCVTPGSKPPKTGAGVSTAGDFPVQNGMANFSLVATAAQIACPPGQGVSFSNVTVTDAGNGIRKSIPGTF
ncbi:hypothetical protein [Streptomyces sp. NPDC002545]